MQGAEGTACGGGGDLSRALSRMLSLEQGFGGAVIFARPEVKAIPKVNSREGPRQMQAPEGTACGVQGYLAYKKPPSILVYEDPVPRQMQGAEGSACGACCADVMMMKHGGIRGRRCHCKPYTIHHTLYIVITSTESRQMQGAQGTACGGGGGRERRFGSTL